MNKKILIGVIVVVILAILGVLLLSGSGDQLVTYDDYFNVTLPAEFETTEINGLIDEAYPQDKSYVLRIYEEDNMTASDIDGEWTYIKDATSNNKELIEQLSYYNITDYTIGNNKYYEVVITDASVIKEASSNDAQKARCVDVVVPNSDKVYGLYFLTNDTSVDLYSADIQAIINSTAAA